MAGISSNALKGMNYPQNRKKYNGIEFTEDLDLDIYDAQLRNLDPQIGRWNQVDPKIENMEMWSPYASNYDNPIRFNDFLGDEPGGPGDRRDGINTGPGDADYYYREDNKGAIVSSSAQDYDQNPVKAALNDAVYLAASVTGFNSLDNYIYNRVAGQNSPKQVATETFHLGLSLSAGKGGKPGEVPNTKLNGKITEPRLPEKTVASDGKVEAVHYTKSGDHGPPHIHIKGGGKETKVGQNGKPIDGSPELTPQQQKFVDNFRKDIRKAIKQIGKWFNYNSK